jgi:hypothetical protein
MTQFARRWAHITPWIYPVWMTGWDFAYLVLAALITIGWGVGEVVVARGRIVATVRRFVG